MNGKMSFEEMKKFQRWKWRQIGIKGIAVLFGIWATFSFIGFMVILGHLEGTVETPKIYAAFAVSIMLLLIIVGVVGGVSILEKGKEDK